MEQPLRGQRSGKRLQPGLGLIEVMQNADGIDVVERGFITEIEQAAALLPQRRHRLDGPRSEETLPSHLQSPLADIHRQHLRAGIEMAEVIGAHTGAAAGIQDPRLITARRTAAMDRRQNAAMAPAPVVSGWRSVLKRIPGKGKAVIERTHYRCRSVTGTDIGHGNRDRANRELFMGAAAIRPGQARPANICSCGS